MKKYFILIASALCFLAASCGKDRGETPDKGDAFDPVPRVMTVAAFINDTTRSENSVAYLSGNVSKVEDNATACFYLADGTGAVFVYGLWDSPAGKRVASLSGAGYTEGSEISIAALRTVVNGRVEAAASFIYSVQTASLNVNSLIMDIPAEGIDTSIVVGFKGEYEVQSSDSWIQILTTRSNAGWKAEEVPLRIEANTGLGERKGLVTISHPDGQVVRVLLVQKPQERETVSVKQAISEEYAHVRGTVTAIFDRGYILSDGTASICVEVASTIGVVCGAEMDVTGTVSTKGFVTSIKPDASYLVSLGTVKRPNVSEAKPEAVQALLTKGSGGDPTVPGVMDISYMCIRGVLRAEANDIRLEDYKGNTLLKLESSFLFNPGSFNNRRILLYGYLLGYSGGALGFVPVEAESTAKNYITVDGDFSDWDYLPEDSFVAVACNPDARLKSLQKAVFFSDDVSLYIHLYINESYVTKNLAQFQIFLDCDGSTYGGTHTGRGVDQFLDNHIDYMTEGSIFSGGHIISYSAPAYFSTAETGAYVWGNWPAAGTSGSVTSSAGVDGECEIKLDKSKWETAIGPGFAKTFGVSIRMMDDNWHPIGALPNAVPTDTDEWGMAHLVKLTAWEE